MAELATLCIGIFCGLELLHHFSPWLAYLAAFGLLCFCVGRLSAPTQPPGER